MTLATADLCDKHGDALQVVGPGLRDYGGRRRFAGRITTVKAREDNSLVREALAEPGPGRVLVVAGGGSMHCAMLGDVLAQRAVDNGWEACILHACVRDVALLAGMDMGIKALGSNPRKSVRRGAGERDAAVSFAGVIFQPGHYVYADEDGIVVAPVSLGAP